MCTADSLWCRTALKTDACFCQEVWATSLFKNLLSLSLSLSMVSNVFKDDSDDNDGDYDDDERRRCRKKKRIKPDFAQFYIQPPFFLMSVENSMPIKCWIVYCGWGFVLAFWAEGGTITPPNIDMDHLSPLFYLSSLKIKADFFSPHILTFRITWKVDALILRE